MRRILSQLLCIFAFSAPVIYGQAKQTFDIAEFIPPTGWAKQVKPTGVVFAKSDTGRNTYAMIVLYASNKSSGDPATDFNADWKQFVAGALPVKGSPEMEPQRKSNGWTIVTGGSTFENASGTSAVILSTYSGPTRKFSAAAIFNSADYSPAIDAFAASLVLQSPAAAQQASAGGIDAAILGTWGRNVGAHMTYGDPVAAGIAGYSKDQYTLNGDGTYQYVSKTFRMSYEKIILVVESGRYSVAGSSLTIEPQKSVIQAWSKLNGGDGWGRMLSSQNRPLEKVTYRYTKHYFSGIDQWQLVLQADRPTDRDGSFSTFDLFPNAWYFSTISANNPKVELPR